jgi:hypothetical protein
LAISRQLGSGGASIGEPVARRLGLRYADRDILHRAALALGVEDAAVDPLEQRVLVSAQLIFSRGLRDQSETWATTPCVL